MDEVVTYLFWLAVLLIAVAYFSGFVTDTQAISKAAVNLAYAGTGRNASGQFAGYPSGSTPTSSTGSGTVTTL